MILHDFFAHLNSWLQVILFMRYLEIYVSPKQQATNQGMTNKISTDLFKQLRIYRRLSFPLLINEVACNRIMKLSSLVAIAPQVYKFSCRLIGKNFINQIIQSTYCKIFTAGNTIQEANEASQYFRNQGIPVILDYCAQGDIHSPDLEANLDENARLFAASAQSISHRNHEMISIKITGLLDMRVLKKWNEAVELRDRIWTQNQVGNSLTYKALLAGLKRINNQITEQDVQTYVRTIHSFKGDFNEFKLSEVEFKINHEPYFIFDTAKNNNKIIKLLYTISSSDEAKLQSFVRRVKSICEPYIKNDKNFRILVDAEQSYVQKGIESISQQLQQQYNQERTYIIPTIQNYLKRSVERTRFEIALAKHRNIKFGAKLVRGAYIVEQTRLAKLQGYENPVVDIFTETTDNYLTSFQEILKNFEEGEVIVATHNFDTINSVLGIKQKYTRPPTVSFAQLLGLADHLTFKLNQDNHTVYKYLPWAETEVMIPYMIRRAQELNQMKYPLDIQFTLLTHQMKARLLG